VECGSKCYEAQHEDRGAPSKVRLALGFKSLTPGDLSSSNTPCFILARISHDASIKACSTFNPDFALASTKSIPSSFAHCSASAYVTSLTLPLAADCESMFLPLTDLICEAVALGGLEDVRDVPAAGSVASSHRSTLFPTRIHET